MADSLPQLELWLAEAKMARHQLLTGKKTASVSYNGKSVSFSQIDLQRLEAYITELLKRIAALTGQPLRRGPIVFTF